MPGWVALPGMYDDGGLSGGTMERPALQRLLANIKSIAAAPRQYQKHRRGKSGRPLGGQACAYSSPRLSAERPPFLKPKKRGLDQWAPVILSAMMVRDPHGWPFHSKPSAGTNGMSHPAPFAHEPCPRLQRN